MNMKVFSEKVGLSSHTLRYYEKIGLLNQVQRNASGHRVYGKKEEVWVGFIKRLKETGMPLEEVLRYATLREAGGSTLLERQHLLEKHREGLMRHIEQQQAHLSVLEEKIDLYKSGKVA
ncbi:MerR family transcriptional regulator [Marinomonas pollencensis]|uniref:DNA-binding transcriptional MerR regulator n=1 Tax=Marinomonas pollencensis TaxID=491954 RepID=A0A3E0DK15_9GAMM|nr:MerR family transcriptional regulator [Marinomonas pollencensis]REG82129.1 DNA-binding transcriptional MerR regulator [Marinomonas pollencensis]